jgi:hypothetical protein
VQVDLQTREVRLKKTASWAPAGACIVFVGWRKKAY